MKFIEKLLTIYYYVHLGYIYTDIISTLNVRLDQPQNHLRLKVKTKIPF